MILSADFDHHVACIYLCTSPCCQIATLLPDAYPSLPATLFKLQLLVALGRSRVKSLKFFPSETLRELAMSSQWSSNHQPQRQADDLENYSLFSEIWYFFIYPQIVYKSVIVLLKSGQTILKLFILENFKYMLKQREWHNEPVQVSITKLHQLSIQD